MGVRHVDQDVAIYWVAAKELAHLRLHEPFFYGQAYNHLAESALAAYERRTWLLLEEARRTRDRLLLTDVSPDEACARVQARIPGATCTPAAAETVLVQLPPESSLAFARAYGLAVRPF